MDWAGQRANDSGSAGVIARPIRLFPAALLLGLGLDRLLPLPRGRLGLGRLGRSRAVVAGGALALAGAALFAGGARRFARAATPLSTNHPARVLVTTGIYGRTRNPIYLGLFLVYAGTGVAVRSRWALALTPAIAAVLRYGVVAREEAYLERRFGVAYREYRARVPRWL